MKLRILALLIVVSAAPGSAWADEPPSPATRPPANQGEAAVNQEILSRQFRSFEESLLRLAQRLERSAKPEDRERAASLKKAIALASDQGVDNKFDKLVEILTSSKALTIQEIRGAMEQNRMLAQDIKTILALLQADNRDAEIAREKQRLAELIKQLEAIIRQQKIVRAQTERGRLDKDPLGKEQEKVTKKTGDVAKAMDKKDKENESKSGEGKPGDGKKGEGKPGEGKPGDGKKGDGKPGDGKQDQQEGSENQQPQNTPGKKQVEEANQHQKQAEKNIQEEKRDEASRQQDKAIEKLEEARKRLEEILRQLREEEKERLLLALQRQCELMLQMQTEVYDATVRIDRAVAETPDHKPARVHEQRALQQADREEEIVRLANKAIQVLEAEGSAVAFPEVFIQVRDDMKNVARRLGKADVASVTQVIEQDIITTLKEMIEALKKAQQKLQNKPSQAQSGQPPDQRLIDLLAELKMIRSMQVRVNTRTRVYGEKYVGEQADEADIQRELADLAQRQLKIFDITNNIYRGKNR
jgi:hypothetical protein